MTWDVSVDCSPCAGGYIGTSCSFAIPACGLDIILRANFCFGWSSPKNWQCVNLMVVLDLLVALLIRAWHQFYWYWGSATDNVSQPHEVMLVQGSAKLCSPLLRDLWAEDRDLGSSSTHALALLKPALIWNLHNCVRTWLQREPWLGGGVSMDPFPC